MQRHMIFLQILPNLHTTNVILTIYYYYKFFTVFLKGFIKQQICIIILQEGKLNYLQCNDFCLHTLIELPPFN